MIRSRNLSFNNIRSGKFCAVTAAIALLLPGASAVRADTPLKPDEGKFIINLQEAEIGSDTFTIKAKGEAEGRVTLNLGGQKIDTHNISTVSDGRLVAVSTEAVGHGKLQLNINGLVGKLLVDDKPRPDQKVDARTLPYSDFSPHLFAFLVAGYDRVKGGPQKFSMLGVDGAGPQGLIALKVTVTALSARLRKVGGKNVPISRYALLIPGPIGNIDSEIDTDVDGRVLLWTVPGQKLAEVREGFQDLLLPETPTDPLLSKPTYTVVTDRKVMVAMRDGVKLATDVYRPMGEGKFPVILQRTPYGRSLAVEATAYAKRGYVFVAQDVRGRFESEGDFHPFVLEAKDGFDAVEWCAAQPWSSGSVGMIGGSYLGFVQWAAAREGSPHLKCLIPIVSPPDPFLNVPYEYGALLLSPDLWWANAVKDRTTISIGSPAALMQNLNAYKTLPLSGVDKAVLGRTIPFFQEWLQHSTNDAYYTQVNFLDHMKTMQPLPALHVSGWFDGDGIGTKLNFARMIAAGQAHQKLIYGPWGHAVNTTTKIGPFDFGPQSLRDLDTLYLRWFDHWLKGIDNGVNREPAVEAFVMGRNEWRSFSAWPPREAKIQKWYLHSNGHAGENTSKGPKAAVHSASVAHSGGNVYVGTLSTVPSARAEPADHYVYDPADPYIPGGAANFQKAAEAQPGEDAKLSLPERRSDLLYYATPVLKEDLVVAGPISLHITAATSGRDTDWFALLEDVYPDGRVAALCKGIVRARFRKSLQTPTLLHPGEIAGYDLDMWALGNVFKKGHRLQVLLTSSCFPTYARNLNTGGDLATETAMVKAKQTLYHTADRPSYLLLPVLPK